MASTTQAYSDEGYREWLRSAGLPEIERHPCLTGRSEALDAGLFVIVAGARRS